MNRRILVLNLALVALACALGWMLRVRYLDARAHERAIFTRAAMAKAVPAPPPVLVPAPISGAEYIEVAQRTLFSKDRNPNVVIQPPPPPPPPPPMPPLPHYHGQMSLFDPVVFLSLDAGVQKGYHVGEKIGAFKVVSWDHDNITLDWDGKSVEKKLQELAPKEAPPPAPNRAAAAAPQGAANPGAKLLGATDDNPQSKKTPVLGNDSGGGFFSCVPGDNSPSGTVVDGYKKVVSRGMFGEVCHWEQVK